ncbi:sugar ABC transporter ATP-binding protein [Roseiflexus sp.]|jgi:ABC-type sugar transport system ATPase subunit|uniref:sugar ABC transporter ATP-binding protein n=1 Tax=Roseiflexus sp. TaxID=2562120 RepID=UPI0025D0D28F|nr:sugar ABC transporter ATP-binding protein [Roseiflexus sp.]MCL6539173.1 sugar ABC transporter ATP-binding protein [Roseiflexus sp.]
MALLLEMRGISKRFGGTQALDQVDFSLDRGEVVGLLGENGAGKSTLIKILAGVHRMDQGAIFIDGKPVTLQTPQDAQRLGIAVIYQELNLTPNQTVAENVFLHHPQRMNGILGKIGIIDHRRRERETAALLAQLGITGLDLRRKVGELSVAFQQLTEIAKALALEARLIVMDEPTSALPDEEVDHLFEIIRRLRERGLGVVFVSHRLNEVRAICDRIVVLRDGKNAGALPVNEASDDRIIAMMVGRSIDNLYPKRPATPGDVVLEVQGLTRRGIIEDISFHLRAGEVVGLAGLVGSGRTEVARAIFGADRIDKGTIRLNGTPVRIRSPQDARNLGIGYVPEDRKVQGLVPGMTVRDNVTLAVLRQLARAGHVVDRSVLEGVARRYVHELHLRPSRTDLPVGSLSGGNQQKVVLAKWLAVDLKVLLLDEPTRGIDVGAKAEIHGLIDELAHRGMAILLISSELPEVLAMSDRILVMSEGRLVGELSREEATQERILALASGRK